MLKCKEIYDGNEFISSDLTTNCAESKEYWIFFAIAFSSLIIQIGIPIFILILLVHHKKKSSINKEAISFFSKNFGYFYLDYSSKCYFWEFVRIFQKFLIISVLMWFSDQEISKGLFIILIILTYGFLTFKLRPNEKQYL
jgi:hypothetical protein